MMLYHHLQAVHTSPNFIKLGTFPDKPLPPGIVNSSVQSKPKCNGLMDILSSSGKTVKQVLPDGNCFFRSLSFCFYGTDDHHLAVRKTLVAHIVSNKRNYSKFLFHGSIDEHVIQMARPCVWATQVELQAAADCYARNIYTLTETPDKNGYHWMLYKPQNDRQQKAGHIELAHFSSVHFDPIVDVLTRNLPQTPPQLQGGTIYHQEVL